MSANRLHLEGRLVSSGTAVKLTIEGSRISDIAPLRENDSERLPWIGPGLVDLQINGYAGIDFNAPPVPESAIHEATRKLWAEGVTSYYPTVITNTDEAIESSLQAIAAACRSDAMTAASVRGIHLEGPFLSPQEGARGAHDAAYIKAPVWELYLRWQEAAEGRLSILTLSPEWEGAPEFISRCAEQGVTVSIGHTSATPEQIREAIAAGARMSTHLGNGAQLMLPRHPNCIWEQLAADELTPGIIADGFHLPESVLKVFLRAKGEQIFIVSDAVYLSGLKPGKYTTHIGGEVVLTEEGRLHLAADPRILAGSARMLRAGIEHLVRTGLCPLGQAWELASARPARFMGLQDLGVTEAGAVADLVTFDHSEGRVRIREVYKQGQKVIGSSRSE